MLFLISVLAAIGGFNIWRRMGRAERQIEVLHERLQALEMGVAVAPLPPSTPATVSSLAPTPPALPSDAPTPAPSVASDRPLETLIGTRWLLYVGIVAIVVGASYFVKLAFDNEWITETTQVLIGGVAGAALAYVGTRFASAGYRAYGQIVSGGGIAVLYVSIYAAFNIYALLPHLAAFALMCVVTMLGAWLADVQRGQGLALAAVGGGFATPFLLATGSDAQIALFTYDAVLVAGTMYLAHRRDWPPLNLVGYVGTVLTLAAWSLAFYTPDKFLTTEIFLTLFAGMFLYLLHESRRATGRWAAAVRMALTSAPILYHLASVVVLYDHATAFFVYLMAASVAGLIAARQLGSSPIRLVAFVAVELSLLLWITPHGGDAWRAALVVVSGVYALNLLALAEVVLRQGRLLDEFDLGLLHLNTAAAYFGAYLLVEPVWVAAAAPMAFGFAVWHAALAGVLLERDRQDALHLAGLAFGLVATAIALQFDGAWQVAGWAAEGAAVVWLGLREQRTWLRAGGGLLLAWAVLLLVALQLSMVPVGRVAFFNSRAACGAFVIALLYGLAGVYRRAVEGKGTVRAWLLVVANLVTVLLLSSEIRDFWAVRDSAGSGAASGYLAREVMLSITWAAYATGLIVVGLRRRYAPIRYLAILMFGITILKVFMVDLAQLEQIYRVLSIVGLGALLLVASYFYQRFSAATSGP